MLRARFARALAVKLREARLASGFSIVGLAARIDVSKVTVAAWELERKLPRADRLVRVADALGVSVAWLIGESRRGGPRPRRRRRT
ncbi:MAG: helix-turn-helix domain-containing protein [Gemmatimonadales bacterium]